MDLNLSNYQDAGFGGFGSEQEVDALIKAMIAGSITGRDTTNQVLGQEPLKVESLETTLKLLDFRMKDIKLWNAIPKLAASNTVEEYLQLVSYGTDRGGFYAEGELSDVEDSQYERRAELVKYIQVTGEVTLQAQVVKSYTDALGKEMSNKTMWVVRKANNSLTKANSAIVPQEFDGLYALHGRTSGSAAVYSSLDAYLSSAAIIDLRGTALNQQNLEDGAINVDAAFGNVDTLFAPPKVIADLGKDYFNRQRILLGATGYTGTPGVTPKAIDTTIASISLNHDKGMKKDPIRYITGAAGIDSAFTAATSAKAPNAPTASNQVLTLDASASCKFVAGEAFTGALGAVFYGVSAVNRYGESALTPLSNTAKITLAAGNSVDLTWADGGGATVATGYVVYRSKVTTVTNATTQAVPFYPIFKVSVAQVTAGYDGGAAGTVRDRNRFLPATEEGFITEMSEEVLSFKQLMPISKLDLAVLAPSKRFMVMLWGMPLLYANRKVVRYINIGPFTASSQ